LLARLLAVGHEGVRIRPLGGSRGGEVRLGRWLRNKRVRPEEMFATARARTAGLVHGRPVLVIHRQRRSPGGEDGEAVPDTTSLRDDGKDTGLYLHPAIAVDAEHGALLGLVSACFLRRAGRQAVHCNNRALADKESRRWIEATTEAGTLLAAGAAHVTVVADREGDIYEEFVCRPEAVEVVIRCHHDRLLADRRKLFAAAAALPELGRHAVELPAKPGRQKRTATLALRASPVRIKRPQRNRAGEAKKLPPTVSLWLVEAREVDAPADAAAILWRLLTTHPVTTLAQAKLITGFYRERWSIEQLFRVMKTKGFNIEAVRIEDTAPFETLAAATLIAAIHVQQMLGDRDGTAQRGLKDVFDPADQPALEAVCTTLEGKTERQKNPHPHGSLAYAAWVCARLGGWTGYYGKPGPVVMLHGYRRFKAMLDGWRIGRLV